MKLFFNKTIPSKKEGKCLTISSLFFLIPSIYAGIYYIYSLSVLSIITTIISINYWREPKLGWRRDMDLIFAKISFVIYFFYGLHNIQNMILCNNALTLYFSIVMIIVFYNLSNYFWISNNANWLYFHIIFHMFVVFGQLTVINGTINIIL